MDAAEAVSPADELEKQRRLFILGLMLLFGWVTVVALCAYPQLFRDFLIRYICCCFAGLTVRRREKYRQRNEMISRAQERMRSASRSFMSISMAANPSAILLKQVGLGGNLVELGLRKKQCLGRSADLFIPEPIPENSELDCSSSRSENDGTPRECSTLDIL